MTAAPDMMLRAWLEEQAGQSPELTAMLGTMLGLDPTAEPGLGPVIDGTAREVTPLPPTGPDAAGLTDEVRDVAAQLDALRQLTSGDQIDLAAWQAEAARSERIIDALTAKLDMLACALGACPECWGGSGACPACGGGGRGHPGAFLPDPDCFDTYVTPVLHLMAGEMAADQQPRHRNRPPGRTARPRRPHEITPNSNHGEPNDP